MGLGNALNQLFGSASRADCDEYAQLLEAYHDGDESAVQHNRRVDLERQLPETVRTMVERGSY